MGRITAEHTLEATLSLVSSWNQHYPPGTPVVVVRDNGDVEDTYTRTVAWVTESGGPFVGVDATPGGYRLSRVIPKPQF